MRRMRAKPTGLLLYMYPLKAVASLRFGITTDCRLLHPHTGTQSAVAGKAPQQCSRKLWSLLRQRLSLQSKRATLTATLERANVLQARQCRPSPRNPCSLCRTQDPATPSLARYAPPDNNRAREERKHRLAHKEEYAYNPTKNPGGKPANCGSDYHHAPCLCQTYVCRGGGTAAAVCHRTSASFLASGSFAVTSAVKSFLSSNRSPMLPFCSRSVLCVLRQAMHKRAH